MSVKINALTIKNFKSFDNIQLDFGESSLVVLDGPNGFGKTTIFDAIELLFTGKIKRYQRIHDLTIDNRHTFYEHPFLCDRCTCEDVEITCKATLNKKQYTLLRIIKNSDLTGAQSVKTIPSKLYQLNEEDCYVEISNESDFFKQHLGQNYNTNFEFINYIEQDENLGYLKQKDSSRKQAINHLFNTQEVDSKKIKLKATEKNIKEFQKKTNEKIKELEANERELSAIKLEYATTSEYVKLILDKEFFWDQKDIDFDKFTYSDILGENSDIRSIEWLINNTNRFKNRLNNNQIELLLHDRSLLQNILSFSHHFTNSDTLKILYLQHNVVSNFLDNSNLDLSKFILSEESILKKEHIDIINNVELIQNYRNYRTTLSTQINSLTELEKCLIELRDSRNAFISNMNHCERDPSEHGKCALCGYDWEQSDTLLDQIRIQSENIESIINLNNSTLNKQLESFSTDCLKLIVEKLINYITSSNFSTNYYEDYHRIFISHDKSKIDLACSSLDKLNILYSDLLNKDYTRAESSSLETLIQRLEEAKIMEQEVPWNANVELIFERVFDNKIEQLELIEYVQVQNKLKYLQQIFTTYASEKITKIRDSIAIEKQTITQCTSAISKLSNIISAYTDSITEYNNSVIEDIEVLFFIYSARIMQFRPSGSGFFINKQSGIRFLEKATNSYDALFKLSSGQLSALVIAFTLALNKKYSDDKLLFIDDPIQTLDDLNISSFMDVLRNDFNDRQIFISTHEDMMSAFMRYKFEKYNLSTTRINLSQTIN